VQQQRIEARVLDIVDIVVNGGRVEDDRVEAKGIWPTDHRRAARQIAGLGNAAAGEPIMWIVGLDENGHRVCDPGDTEPSNWWNQVSSRFSEIPPDLTLLRVATPHGNVAVLWMDTGRTPYVVTTDGAGGVGREVPWRRGTALRSAHRSEILRSVIREAEAPQLDPITGWVRIVRPKPRRGTEPFEEAATPGSLELTYSLKAFVEAHEPARLPEYRWTLEVRTSDWSWPLPIARISGPRAMAGSTASGLTRYEPVGSIVYVEGSGLHINGSDSIRLSGYSQIPDESGHVGMILAHAKRLDLAARFPIALSSRRAALDTRLRRSRRTTMEKRENPLIRHIDERLAEFSYGGGRPPEYQGRAERIESIGD
jgi:hypothetical protein